MLICLSSIGSEKERSSFQKIYEDNYLQMFHAALGILKHQMDAENAVHEAFVSIAENYKKYLHLTQSEITGLCITAVKHKCIDSIRRQNHLSEEELEDLILYNENADYQPEVHAERREQEETLHRILAQMPETLQIVLDLKYFYDLNNREIADQLGISKKTVEMRLYRAKQKLREMIKNEDV